MSRCFLLKEEHCFLEQMMTFLEQETTEVRHRIRCAWSTFAKHRQEATSQSYFLRHRLHLFDADVTPTVTCGAGNIRMYFSPVSFFVFSLCLDDESKHAVLCSAEHFSCSSVVAHVPAPYVIVGVTTAWKRCDRCSWE